MNTQNIEQMYCLYKWTSNSKTNCTRKIVKGGSIFSRNITAVGNKTFDANCLNACDTPIYTGGPGYVPGTIFACNSGGAGVPALALPLYIQY